MSCRLRLHFRRFDFLAADDFKKGSFSDSDSNQWGRFNLAKECEEINLVVCVQVSSRVSCVFVVNAFVAWTFVQV